MRKSSCCSLSVFAKAAAAHTEYAQKLLLRSLSMRQSFWENVIFVLSSAGRVILNA